MFIVPLLCFSNPKLRQLLPLLRTLADGDKKGTGATAKHDLVAMPSLADIRTKYVYSLLPLHKEYNTKHVHTRSA